MVYQGLAFFGASRNEERVRVPVACSQTPAAVFAGRLLAVPGCLHHTAASWQRHSPGLSSATRVAELRGVAAARASIPEILAARPCDKDHFPCPGQRGGLQAGLPASNNHCLPGAVWGDHTAMAAERSLLPA